MSAWVVDNAHINALVNWANDHKRKRQLGASIMADNPQALGQLLLDANIESVNYRYAHNKDAQCEPETFVWKPSRARDLSTVEAIKSLQCLDYQSCEKPDWDKTQPARIIRELISAAIAELPGYDAAPWGIDEDKPQARAAAR